MTTSSTGAERYLKARREDADYDRAYTSARRSSSLAVIVHATGALPDAAMILDIPRIGSVTAAHVLIARHLREIIAAELSAVVEACAIADSDDIDTRSAGCTPVPGDLTLETWRMQPTIRGITAEQGAETVLDWLTITAAQVAYNTIADPADWTCMDIDDDDNVTFNGNRVIGWLPIHAGLSIGIVELSL